MVTNVPGQDEVGHGCGYYRPSEAWCSLRTPSQDLRDDNHTLSLAIRS